MTIPEQYIDEPWANHPGYEAFYEWIQRNVEYLGDEEIAEVVEGLEYRRMPPPSVAAMSSLAKWASTASDNVEELRANAQLREEFQEYTEDWNLDQIDPLNSDDSLSGSVYQHQIFRALRLPMEIADFAHVVSGEDDLEILRHPAESWSLSLPAAHSFIGFFDEGVVLYQDGPRPDSLIWNFMNPVLGYRAFRSKFDLEQEVILESQCDSCSFEEIARVNFGMVRLADLPEFAEGRQALEEAMESRGYEALYHMVMEPDETVILHVDHSRRNYYFDQYVTTL